MPTNNVLLKISIPKRRRKIERARVVSQVASLPERADAETLYHKLQTSNGNYTIEALGTIICTLRFRGFDYILSCFSTSLGNCELTTFGNSDIADFQFSTMHSPFAKKFREHLIDFRCLWCHPIMWICPNLQSLLDDKIKHFNLNPGNSMPHPDIMPPPTFSKSIIPHLYK